MSATPLERITALLRLSGSDNANEATNAAVVACRMIRQHGFVVVPSIEAAQHLSPVPPHPPAQHAHHAHHAHVRTAPGNGTGSFAEDILRSAGIPVRGTAGEDDWRHMKDPALGEKVRREQERRRGEDTARKAREILENASRSGRERMRPITMDTAMKGVVMSAAKSVAKESAAKSVAKESKNVMRPVVMASPKTTPIEMKAKFSGRCEDCHLAYAQGDAIWYRRGVGSVHGACSPEALV